MSAKTNSHSFQNFNQPRIRLAGAGFFFWRDAREHPTGTGLKFHANPAGALPENTGFYLEERGGHDGMTLLKADPTEWD